MIENMKAHATPLTTSRVSAAGLHCAAFICESAAKATNINALCFAPGADIGFSASRQIVYKRLTLLSPALASHLRSTSDTGAWICVQSIISAHENASQKHNNQLGATSPHTPP